MSDKSGFVWVFIAEGATFPCGVFSSHSDAVSAIHARSLTGVLTEYPIGALTYDFAVDAGWFEAAEKFETNPRRIGKFTSQHQRHFHYENGRPR